MSPTCAVGGPGLGQQGTTLSSGLVQAEVRKVLYEDRVEGFSVALLRA